jgi:hypothetical protein
MSRGTRQHPNGDEAWTRTLYKAVGHWEGFTELLEAERSDGLLITEVRIQGPNATGAGFRAVIKATDGAKHWVAFHNADSTEDLVAGVLSRLNSDVLKWREDAPYQPKEAPRTREQATGEASVE